MMSVRPFLLLYFCFFLMASASPRAFAVSAVYGDRIYDPGHLKPVDSTIAVAPGDKAPDFSLPSISGRPVSLSQFLGKKNVLLSFIPAAWTPVCSDQWPGYNIARPFFDQSETVIIGISTDNVPTLYAWTRQMGDLWFDVLSDFWPHGEVSRSYGVLRTDGMAERALILVDKKGMVRFIHVSDINARPDLKLIVDQMNLLEK